MNWRPSGLTEVHRCPKCGKPSSLMAGVNVRGGDKDRRYLVCWKDKQVRMVATGAPWCQIGAEPIKEPWAKHSNVHWSMVLQGETLDYWPTKRKWRHAGQMYSGDVEDYIRSVEG